MSGETPFYHAVAPFCGCGQVVMYMSSIAPKKPGQRVYVCWNKHCPQFKQGWSIDNIPAIGEPIHVNF